MQHTFTRDARRKMRALAKTAAPIMARTFTDNDPTDDNAAIITDPRAVAALERATRLMLAEGGKVQIIEIKRETAAVFPGIDLADVPIDARHFLAVGLDVDMRAAFTVKHIAVDDRVDRMAARREVERLMKIALLPHLIRSGWEGCA